MRLVWTTPKPTDSFIPKLKKAVSQLALDKAMNIWLGVVDRTLVDSGELRASWNLSVGKPDFTTVGEAHSSPGSAGGTLPKPSRPKLQAVPLINARYFVANGKTYGPHVEFGTQSIRPQLMLTRAIQMS